MDGFAKIQATARSVQLAKDLSVIPVALKAAAKDLEKEFE